MSRERYVPAAGRRGLTALYDPVVALTMREQRFRGALVAATLAAEPREILDLGCGTGTLAVKLALSAPQTRLIGVDGDPDVLRRAAAKARAARVELELLEGSATAIPLADASVDCVVSSLLLHHLSSEGKHRALGEVHRVLRTGGLFLLADWGEPSGPLMRAAFLAVQLLDGFENTRAHRAGELPDLMERSGFSVARVDRLRTLWGTLELLAATPHGRVQRKRAA